MSERNSEIDPETIAQIYTEAYKDDSVNGLDVALAWASLPQKSKSGDNSSNNVLLAGRFAPTEIKAALDNLYTSIPHKEVQTNSLALFLSEQLELVEKLAAQGMLPKISVDPAPLGFQLRDFIAANGYIPATSDSYFHQRNFYPKRLDQLKWALDIFKTESTRRVRGGFLWRHPMVINSYAQIGTVIIDSPIKDYRNQWDLDVYGNKHLEELTGLGTRMGLHFNNSINIRKVTEDYAGFTSNAERLD